MLNIIISLSILFLIIELRALVWPKNYDRKVMKIKSDVKQGFLNPLDRPFLTLHLVYFIWSIVGLFTSLWYLFLIFIVFSFISSNAINKTDNMRNRLIIRRIDAIFSISIIITLIIQHIL
jgi:hypothetical protein